MDNRQDEHDSSDLEKVAGTIGSPVKTNEIYRHRDSGIFFLEWKCVQGWCLHHSQAGHIHRVALGTTDLKEAQLWSYEKDKELRSIQRSRWPRLTLLQPFSSGTYIVQAGPEGPIKIGFSSQVLRRLYSLYKFYRDADIALTLLGVVQGNVEKRLHARFKDSRLIGEWFSPTPYLVRLLETQDISPLPNGFGGTCVLRPGRQPLSGKTLINVLKQIHNDPQFRRTLRTGVKADRERKSKDLFHRIMKGGK